MGTTKLMSLQEIFNQKILRIPDFQRGYSWEKKQLDEFWEDIENLKSDKIHYTGLLTVEPINRKDKLEKDNYLIEELDYKPFYIIDGQQRITTSIIFIEEILKSLTEEEIILGKKKNYWIEKFLFQKWGELNYLSYIFGYEKDDPSNEFFKTKILETSSSKADKVPNETLYTKNLQFAKNYFNEKIDKLKKEERTDYFRKIINKFKYNFYEVDGELNIYVTFETMNNRGKSLSNLELLKNRLIYLTTLLDDEMLIGELRNDINETWKTIYEYLGKSKEKLLNDDEFLKNHWIMYFKYDRAKSNSYANYLLSEKFTPKRFLNKEVEVIDIKNYIKSLQDSIKTWYFFYNPESSHYNSEIVEWLNKLNRLGFGAFRPLLIAAFNKETEEANLLKLLKSSEKFIFLIFKISRRPSNLKDSYFYKLANSYYHEKEGITIFDIIASIDKFNTDETQGWCDLTLFEKHIKELFQRKQGYYSWNDLKYFLYEYEIELQIKAKSYSKISWIECNKKDSIEHIYPQTPNNKYWEEMFSNVDIEKKKKIIHSLGNLVPISISKNSELKNREFDYKKNHINKNENKVGFFNGSYSEIEIAQFENWGYDEIIKRGLKLLDFLENRWGIKFESWGIDKKNLLIGETK